MKSKATLSHKDAEMNAPIKSELRFVSSVSTSLPSSDFVSIEPQAPVASKYGCTLSKGKIFLITGLAPTN